MVDLHCILKSKILNLETHLAPVILRKCDVPTYVKMQRAVPNVTDNRLSYMLFYV